MALTLTELRLTLRDGMLQATSGTYGDDRIDRAIRFVGDHFVTYTNIANTTTTKTVTSGTATVDFTSGAADFRAERFQALRTSSYDEVKLTDWEHMRRLHDNNEATGKPEWVAFETTSGTATLWPTPDDGYTLTLKYVMPFVSASTSWTMGTTDSGDVTFNVPDEYLTQIVMFGGAAVVQHNDPSQQFETPAWQKYLQIAKSVRGKTNVASTIRRDPSKFT